MSQYRLHKPIARIAPEDYLSRYIGPLEDCAARVWAQLTDFDSWYEWMPGIESVTPLEQGDLGRGSILRLQQGLRDHNCRISHWHPMNRIDLNISAVGKRLGYSFSLNTTDDQHLVELRLATEFEFSGLHGLLNPLFTALEKRRARQLLVGFQRALQAPGN